ncbi:MAG: GxxExxY protein [Zetaproteobacteria bacterium CG_4_9_14_3_um_filter_53_7]|nr:MAG: GxxExxY protein [Zetaproteobacteria bacterium CG_4_9_14_3_um_filter_53_7]
MTDFSPQRTPRTQRINELSGKVVEAAMSVHSSLGPGLLESVYEVCLHHELEKLGLSAQAQVPISVHYDNLELDAGFRIDLLVESEIIVELKSVEQLMPIHQAQLLTYLKLAGKPVGLLINFNTVHLRDGIKRMVNHL